MNQITFFLGADSSEPLDLVLERSSALLPWKPFDPRAVDFVARFSQHLLTHPQVRQFPELAALGHWFRAARLRDLARKYPADLSNARVVGRGLVFHLAPANVDSVFMYSWLLSLLAGNTNFVRVSQKLSPQLGFLIEILGSVLQEEVGAAVAGRFVLLTYPHDDAITRAISLRCMVRVVWGGDATVATIRAIPLRPTATEICFPDRFSVAAIKSQSILDASDAEIARLAADFYNDTFWFAQQACSSPRLLTWIGGADATDAAHQRFWQAVRQEVMRRNPENTPAMEMARLGAAFELAAAELARPQVDAAHMGFPALLNLEAPISGTIKELHCGNGLFLEQRFHSLDELGSQLSDKEQTLAVYGFSHIEISALLDALPARALDRVAPIGQALAFDPVWDGTDLIVFFTRRISFP
ncbi:acyl-CoA reductase [Massilia sp. GCM10023247]|uniref:acyl-CoA reductase n=1 Tax=Massilia sp. GCM10023247 TaxID=3252643 RepID=UPI00360EDA7B